MFSYAAAKLVPLAYGIKKLQIGCVVEDDKVCAVQCSAVQCACDGEFYTLTASPLLPCLSLSADRY